MSRRLIIVHHNKKVVRVSTSMTSILSFPAPDVGETAGTPKV
jgi:hypothetical protein